VSDQWGERIGRVEERLKDLRSDFDNHLEDAKSRSSRVRELENAVLLLVQAQKEARRAEEGQYRRLEVKIQWLALAVAFAGLLIAAATFAVHH
jgi:hypothetical protein